MTRRPFRRWTAGLLAAAAWAAGDAAHAGFVWEQEWLASAPMTFGWPRSQPDQKVAFGGDGGVLVEGRSPMYARFDATGALRWSLDTPFLYSTTGMTATADGGAYMLATGSSGSQLLRVDPGGSRTWSRAVPALHLVEVGGTRIAAADLVFLTVLDAATGDVLWQRRINNDAAYATDLASVESDASGNLYVTTGSAAGLRTIKFDDAGNEQWNVGGAAPGEGGIVGVGATMLFERYGDLLRARRASDGSVAWTADIHASDIVLATDDVAREPIVASVEGIRRFAADTGQARWTATLPNPAYPAGVIGGRLIVSSSAQLVALDVTSGNTAWAVARPAVDAYGNDLVIDGVGAGQGGLFFLVGHPSGPYQRTPLFLQRTRLVDGAAMATPTPALPQRTVAASIAPQAGYAIGASASQHATTVDIQLRKIDAATGTVIWQMSDPISESVAAGPLYPTSLALAEHAGKLATTSSLQQQGCVRAPSGARVSLHEAASGARLWSALLTDPERACTNVYEPQLDDAGNVFVSTYEGYSCGNGQTCREAAIYKLAAGDGQVVWRDAREADYEPRGFVLAGGRAVTTLPFRGGATFQGLSVATGGTAWSSALYPGYGIDRYVFKVDDTHVVVVGESASGTSWAKLDAATGAVSWDRSVAHERCASLCFENGPVVLPGGDLLIHGSVGSRALLRRFHNDGSGIVDEWLVGGEAPSQQTWVNRAELDEDGRLDLQLARRPGKQTPPSLHTFARFDMADGVLSDEQVIAAYGHDPVAQLTYPDLLRQIDAGRFLVRTDMTRAPQTGAAGVALLDLAATAHGDLAIEARLDPASAVIGDSIGFRLHVTYTGDAALQGATVFAHMPWASGVTTPACTTHVAGNCVVEVGSGDVRATFDISPGGSVDLSGRVRVLGYPARPLLSAYVHGSTALGESDMRNNFATAETSVFLDGFEAH